ncbi:MAG: 3'-5' exonuclease [Spirochaetota bacterium]
MDREDIKYLVFDVESVPDGKLIKLIKYPDDEITEDEAVVRFQNEILEITDGKSNFIPPTFQYPICVVIAKVDEKFELKEIVSLDEGNFSPEEMTRKFWYGIEVLYKKASLVTFNGRGFDVPLLELMGYRYGFNMSRHFTDKYGTRYRFGTRHIDLQEYLSNYNATKMAGGLNLLAKVLGLPGKMETSGEQVYEMHRDGKMKEINDYCIHDVLDTYFVFLRTRVNLGKLSQEDELKLYNAARQYMLKDSSHSDAYSIYMEKMSSPMTL